MSEFEAAGRLLDRRIEDANGRLVGRVDDLLLDISSGQIEYVLIALRDRSEVATEIVTVPWSLVQPKTRSRLRWRIGVERTVLERIAADKRSR